MVALAGGWQKRPATPLLIPWGGIIANRLDDTHSAAPRNQRRLPLPHVLVLRLDFPFERTAMTAKCKCRQLARVETLVLKIAPFLALQADDSHWRESACFQVRVHRRDKIVRFRFLRSDIRK